jgi:hypothetical protein
MHNVQNLCHPLCYHLIKDVGDTESHAFARIPLAELTLTLKLDQFVAMHGTSLLRCPSKLPSAWSFVTLRRRVLGLVKQGCLDKA